MVVLSNQVINKETIQQIKKKSKLKGGEEGEEGGKTERDKKKNREHVQAARDWEG